MYPKETWWFAIRIKLLAKQQNVFTLKLKKVIFTLKFRGTTANLQLLL